MFAVVAVSALLQAAQPAPATLHTYTGLALSPNAELVADFEADEPIGAVSDSHSVLTLRSAKGAVLGRFEPCGPCKYSGAAWSPDSRRLVFLAADKKGVATLYLLEDGKLRVLTSVNGLAATPRWSPDGNSIAILATIGARKATGAAQAGARQIGEIGTAEKTDAQRIAVLSAGGGELEFVSSIDTYVYEYDWTPDSKGFVGTAAKGDGDNNWWVASLQAFTRDGQARVIATPKTQISAPHVSPDGKIVAFIGGLMSDFGDPRVVGGDVYTVPFAGGEPKNLTEGYKGTFTSLAWTARGPVVSAVLGGDSAMGRIDPNSGKVTILSRAAIRYSANESKLSVAPSGVAVASVVESYEVAPEIQVGAPGALRPITRQNAAVRSPIVARSISWKSDGFDVQGWLFSPSDLVPGKTYPMVVEVHGGPSAAVVPKFTTQGEAYDLVKAGYLVFQPNPRGSFGQGEAFKRSNRRDFGGGDLRDILAGVDAVEKIAPVDDERLAITGHSYGGFMAMWAVTHTDRFKAAIAGAGIANWVSYYGQNGIDQWLIPFFGDTAYNDPAIYDRLSPIRSIKAAKAPTLIYVGERDVECPPAQSLEFWHGLRTMNVPTTLVIYEGEGHSFQKPENSADVTKRILAWLSLYLGG